MTETSDLSRLSRTCKAWHAIVVPRLFRHLILEVPQKENRLTSLETLVALAPEGLKYTQSLSVVPWHRRYPIDALQALPKQSDLEGLQPSQTTPDRTVIERIFNALLRLIVLKIPQNTLRKFV